MKNQFPGTRFHYNHFFLSSPIQLDMIELIQIGEICLEATFEVPTHKQFCYEISYIISGKGFFQLNEERLAVFPGDIIITPNNGNHTIYASEDDSIFYAYVGFNFTGGSNRIPQDIRDYFIADKQLPAKDNNDIYDCFRKCMDEFYKSTGIDKLLVESYLLQIVILSCRSIQNSSDSLNYDTIQNPGQLVYRIMKYVNQNIYKPITVHTLAKNLGYSSHYLSHTFKAKMSLTLQDYIGECKIEKSKELLGLRRFTITEISEKLGYINIQSFSRAFKNKTGVYPSVYLKKLCNTENEDIPEPTAEKDL